MISFGVHNPNALSVVCILFYLRLTFEELMHHHVLDILKLSSPPIICGKSMISNNAANYAANIKDTFIDTRSCASAKLPSQARAQGGNQDQKRDKNKTKAL